MILSRIEKYRKPHPAGLSHKVGDDFGWFEIPTSTTGPKLRVQISAGFEQFQFEHASVSLAHRCPTWDEMCKVKDLIWNEEDTVVQFHPPKSEYINNMPFCLHLWRWIKGEFPRPGKGEVGL